MQRLEVTPFPLVAQEIITGKSSGQLVIARGPVRRVLYWAHGELILVLTNNPAESLWSYLVHEKLLDAERAAELQASDPLDVVPTFHTLGVADSMRRNIVLRNWLSALVVPLFAAEEGTAIFTDEEPLEPERRIFLQSIAPVVVTGIRAITNGLIIRNSLGDLKKLIMRDEKSSFALDMLPLTEVELKIASSLREATPLEKFIKDFANDSAIAAKVVIAMMTLGIFEETSASVATVRPLEDDPQRDLALLAAIGPNDPRSLKAVIMSRQLSKLDYYTLLDLPRGATGSRVVERCELLKREYNPTTYPPAARPAVTEIHRAIEVAQAVLSHGDRRQLYDRMLTRGAAEGRSVEQVTARRQLAFSNLERAKDLAVMSDYYGAIILLKQTVHFDPSLAEAWHLLGTCQERNPKWRRDAAISYQKALAADPNLVEAMVSLGDLYRVEGLTARAQTFYEDVLAIDPDHVLAKKRLNQLKQ